MILLRLLICLLLFYLPFILALLLLFPLFGTIPAVLGALLFFLPIEMYLSAHGLSHWNNVVIPVAGSLLIVIFMFVVLIVSGNPSPFLSQMCKGGSMRLARFCSGACLGQSGVRCGGSAIGFWS